MAPDHGPRTADRAFAFSTHDPRSTTHASPDPGPRTADPDLPEPPPFGRSWAGIYAVVAGTLLALIALFAAFTRAFE